METIDIPGGTAKIRSVGEMTVRQKRMIQKTALSTTHIYARIPEELLKAATAKIDEDAQDKERLIAEKLGAQQRLSMTMATLELSEADAEAFLGQQDSSIVAFLANWDLVDENGQPKPLPTLETVQDLTPDVYDALAVATAKPAAELIIGTVNMEPVPREVDPDAPFGESGTSNGQSSIPATPTPPSTGRQRKGTESTVSASSTT